MRTATLSVRSLIDRIDRGEIRLPEIQRAYVWKPPAIAGLIESLYRRYPSGSLLMWEADKVVEERSVDIDKSMAKPMVKPLYLLDGQQRLTSLHRAYHEHDRAVVVFDVANEKFQVDSAATRKDPRFVRVASIINEDEDTYDVVERLRSTVDLPPKLIHDRLEQLRRINEYSYYLEVLEELPYEEVTEIFVRVNSRGRSLKTTDLALATLSARWPKTVARFEEQEERWKAEGYHSLDATFLTRCLAAMVSETATPRDFATAAVGDLERGWEQTKRGVEHVVKLLQGHLMLDAGWLIPSVNALVPAVTYLGTRKDVPLDDDSRDALLYWLLGAWLHARFSSSAQTVISQDVAAVRSEEPLTHLLQNLGIFGQRLVVTPEMLVGRGSTSPYFFLSYLCARAEGANDWWHNVPVSAAQERNYVVEYHHIHPKATLKNRYGKAEINDLANLVFISAKANRKISDRSPHLYFSEVGDSELERHAIPLAEELRTAENLPAFVAARRTLLAAQMTDLLDRFRPSNIETSSASAPDPSLGETVELEAFGDGAHALLVVTAISGSEQFRASLMMEDIDRLLADVADGRGSEIVIGSDVVDVDVGSDEVMLPFGPLRVSGSVAEWRKVLEREREDRRPLDEAPAIDRPPPWEGERQPFSVLDSE